MLKRLQENKLVLAISAIVLVFVVIWFIGISETTPTKEQKEADKTGAIVFDGSNLEERSNGKLVWKVDAKNITMDQEGKLVYLTGVTGEFHDKDGKVLRLTADKGTANIEKKQIAIHGNIKATHDDGSILTGEALIFDSQKHLLMGTKPFQLKRKDATLSGDSFTCDLSLEKLKVKGNAKLVKEQ